MKRTGLLIMATILSMAMSAINVEVPCELGLDEAADAANWTINPTTGSTWAFGSATWYQGTGSMYVSANNGKGMSYTDATAQRMVAYLPITMAAANDYTVSFHYKGESVVGEDYLSFAILSDVAAINDDANFEVLESDLWWHAYSQRFSAVAGQTYYLAFAWNTNGDGNVVKSPAIDDILIANAVSTGFCAATPRFLTSTRSSNNQLIEWFGFADEYELELFQPDTKVSYTYSGITAVSYSLARKNVAEGVYSVRVRAICDTDTSTWTSLDNQFIYGKTHRCYDYMNTNGAELHYMPGEVDAILGEALPAFPANEVGAIKLDNTKSKMSYNFTVNANDDVLKLYYAAVYEDNFNDPQSSMYVLVEYGTQKDTIYVLNDETAQPMWKDTTINGTSYTWKNWSMMGISLREYNGKKVKLSVCQKYKDASNHQAYSYFAIGCEPSEISAPKCGDKPNALAAPEGFFYRWYDANDPGKTTLAGTDKMTQEIAISAEDTKTYSVDVISYADPANYYTVSATALAQILYADFKLSFRAENCTNYVQVINYSHVERVYWDANGKEIVVDTVYDANKQFAGMTYSWAKPVIKEGTSAIIEGGTDTVARPRVIVGEDGGYLTMKLTVKTATGCSKTVSRTIHIDSIGEKVFAETHYTGLALAEQIADSASSDTSLVYKGKTYRAYGTYVDTLTTVSGCDSIISLTIAHFLNDTIRDTAAICQSENGGYQWGDTLITTSGDYTKWVKSLVYTSCDSIFKMLHIDVTPTLEVKLDTAVLNACLVEDVWALPYTYVSGSANAYSVLWDEAALKAGLINQVDSAILDTLPLLMGEAPKPGNYHAKVIFAGACDTVSTDLTVQLTYQNEAITQRWNTLLGVSSEVVEEMGNIVEYQWYKNGEVIEGAHDSYLYVEEGLDGTAAYSVAFKQEGGSDMILTCQMTPQAYVPTVDPTVSVLPTLIRPGDDVKISVSVPGKSGVARLYNETGNLQSGISFNENAVLYIPRIAGIYMMQVVLENGTVETKKIIVE